jgi:hypothetical protein
MTITVDWQAEIGGLVMGAGTSYILTGPITGLGTPPPRTADQERGNEPGDVAGADIASRRVLTVPVGVDGSDAADAWELYDDLKVAWQSSVVDVTFDLRLPGFDSVDRRYYGRARGIDDNLDLLRLGYIDALCTFEALDPHSYDSAETEIAVDATGVPLVAVGSAPSDRYTLAVTATGAPVSFSADGLPGLTLTDVTGAVVIDGRARTIVDGDGVSLYGHLAAGSAWPILAATASTVSLTGATGTLTYRPAYL